MNRQESRAQVFDALSSAWAGINRALPAAGDVARCPREGPGTGLLDWPIVSDRCPRRAPGRELKPISPAELVTAMSGGVRIDPAARGQ
jgi:hypothetical protein